MWKYVSCGNDVTLSSMEGEISSIWSQICTYIYICASKPVFQEAMQLAFSTSCASHALPLTGRYRSLLLRYPPSPRSQKTWNIHRPPNWRSPSQCTELDGSSKYTATTCPPTVSSALTMPRPPAVVTYNVSLSPGPLPKAADVGSAIRVELTLPATTVCAPPSARTSVMAFAAFAATNTSPLGPRTAKSSYVVPAKA